MKKYVDVFSNCMSMSELGLFATLKVSLSQISFADNLYMHIRNAPY